MKLYSSGTSGSACLKEHPALAIPRSVVDFNKRKPSLHGFSDTSKSAVCAAVYVVAKYLDGSLSQNLLVSKLRIAPKNTLFPRLELNAALTLAKLLSHATKALDPTVLYWLENKGKWSQYVGNRVAKIQDLGSFVWHYVPTAQNPSVTRLTLLRTVFVKVTRHRFVM